jgi:DNA-binding NtrC family response regulator
VPETVPASIRRRVEKRTLHLAPLRDRPDDLPRLARFFLHREAMRYDFVAGARTHEANLQPDADAALCRLDLPGNFRELRSLLSAALLRSESGVVRATDLGVSARTPVVQREVAEPVEQSPGPAITPSEDDDAGSELDRSAILEALASCQGNRTVAAQRLGITRGKLLRQMKKLGIQ